MAAAFRLAAFLASAVGIEFARGAGFVTFGAAALIGASRGNLLLAIAAVACGTALSLAMPEDLGTAGKVTHGLSNAPFLVLVHTSIGIAGLALGRLIRHLRR